MKSDVLQNYLRRTGFPVFHPRTILFDMDGVLIDSMPNHVVAWRESMASFGIQMTAMDSYMTEGARGVDTIRKMVEKQQGRVITQDEAQEMYNEKSRLFHLMTPAPLMPGILELMEKLTADGLTIGIVTGSGQRPLIDRIRNTFRQYVTDDHLVTAYDVTKGKPDPAPYLMGMQKCGAQPWETIVVENAPLGVQAGNAAKAFTIAVNTGILPDEALADAGADIILKSIAQLSDQWRELYKLLSINTFERK